MALAVTSTASWRCVNLACPHLWGCPGPPGEAIDLAAAILLPLGLRVWGPPRWPQAWCLHRTRVCSGQRCPEVSGLKHRILLKDPTWAKNKHTHPHLVLDVQSPVNRKTIKTQLLGASLVAQWLRVRLPMQWTRVRAPVREDPLSLIHISEPTRPY